MIYPYNLLLRILDVTAKYDDCGGLWWRTDGEYAPVTIFINCNDLFLWGCADAEAITPANIGMLEQAYADASKAFEDGSCYAQLLFCCRVRGMRPQKPYYDIIPKQLHTLFDECGIDWDCEEDTTNAI